MKKLLYPILSLIVLAGCTKNEIAGVDTESQEIRVKSGVNRLDGTVSRGEGMKDSKSFPLNAASFALAEATGGTVGASTYTGAAYKAAAQTINFNAAAVATSFTTKQYYLANGLNTKLIGWHPAGTFTSASREVTYGVIDGSTDILVTQLKEGSKNAGDAVDGALFEHLLTQITVNAFAKSDDILSTVWGGITEIQIVGKAQPLFFTLPDPATAAEETKVADIEIKAAPAAANLPLVKRNPLSADPRPAVEPNILGKNGGAVVWGTGNEFEYPTAATSAGAKLAGYAMFAPSAAGVDLKLIVSTTKGVPTEVTVPAPAGGFQKGYRYDINLELTSAEILPIVSIKDWETGATIEVPM